MGTVDYSCEILFTLKVIGFKDEDVFVREENILVFVYCVEQAPE